MSQYGTMHVTGNITPEMPRVLARRETGAEEARIDCEKEDRQREGTLRRFLLHCRDLLTRILLDGIACLDKNFVHLAIQDYKEAYFVK